jgi:hypothetical protein
MASRQNNLSLLLLWIPIVLLGVLLLGGLIVSGPRGWTIIAITLVFVLGVRFYTINQVKKLLRQESPEKLVNYYRRSGKGAGISAESPLITATVAQTYALYGEFDQVRVQLASVNWSKCKPMIAAAEPLIQCFLCYFESRNFSEGLILARRARELGQVSSIFPGGSASNSTFDMYVEVGEVLTRNFSPTTVKHLERKLAKAPILIKPFIAWGLAVAYAQMGQSDKVESMRSLILSLAPYCRSLTTLPTLN